MVGMVEMVGIEMGEGILTELEDMFYVPDSPFYSLCSLFPSFPLSLSFNLNLNLSSAFSDFSWLSMLTDRL